MMERNYLEAGEEADAGAVAAAAGWACAGVALAGGVGRYKGPRWPQADSSMAAAAASAIQSKWEDGFTIKMRV
jgi:hypothetical protein